MEAPNVPIFSIFNGDLSVTWVTLAWSTFILSISVYIIRIHEVVRQAYFTPLSAIPGPWYAKFTGLPGTFAALSQRQVDYYHDLHLKNGPFIRVAPNVIFVSDLDAFKKIHRVGGYFTKAKDYNFFGPNDPGKPPYGLFQMTDVRLHAARRKLLARGFTAASLRDTWEESVFDKVTEAVHCMRQAAVSHGEVDIRKWWMLMASDVASNVIFGKSFDKLQVGKADAWFDDVWAAGAAGILAMTFPYMYSVAKSLPFVSRCRVFHANKALFERGKAAVTNSRQGAATKNLFAKVLEESSKESTTLSDEDISVEAGALMVAGSDTTSNSLTYLVWIVLSNPKVQLSLETEVAEVTGPLTDARLESLPILNSIIQETLRLYGAAPTPEPRVSPPQGVELGGYTIPGGTVVSTQSWTLHRDPKNYEDPLKFDYTRWLPWNNGKGSGPLYAAWAPFGAGSHTCIGKNLAMMELRLGTAIFFRELRGCKLAPSTTPESMEIRTRALIEPKGKTCNVMLASS